MSIFQAEYARVFADSIQEINQQPSNSIVENEISAISNAVTIAYTNGLRTTTVGGSTTMTAVEGPLSASPPSPFVGDIEVVGSSTPLPDGRVGTINFVSDHELTTGDTVDLSDWEPVEWNDSFTATVVDSDTITIPFVTPPATTVPSSVGSITTPVVASVSTTSVREAYGTLTFLTDHGLETGANIQLRGFTPSLWNGTYEVTEISSTELTIDFAGTPPTSLLAIGFIEIVLPAISSGILTGSSGEITFAEPHGLTTGMTATLTGWDPPEWNGTYTITVFSPFVIIISFVALPATSATTIGTVEITPPDVYDAIPTPPSGTINFSVDHGLVVDKEIILSDWSATEWNGTYAVKEVPSSTSLIIHFVYPNQPAGTASVVGSIDRILPSPFFSLVTGSTATSSNGIGTIAFTSPHGLSTGQQIILSNFTVAGWDGTYTITVTSSTEFTISFLEQSESYYQVWQGTATDTAKKNYMNTVIEEFENAGYTIERIPNTITGTTFLWRVSW